MSRRIRRARGYTVIEVMMAIVLLVIGSAGVLAMEKAATIGNMRAKELSVATHIGQTWVERLRADGTSWTLPSLSNPTAIGNIAATKWLGSADTQPNVWFRPADDAARGSAGFDVLGNDIPAATAANAVYCTNVRMNWLYRPTGGTASTTPEVVRAEVRVFWKREGSMVANTTPLCDGTLVPSTLVTAGSGAFLRYHFAYFTTTIMKNTAP